MVLNNSHNITSFNVLNNNSSLLLEAFEIELQLLLTSYYLTGNIYPHIYKNKEKTLIPNWTPGLKEMLKFMLDEANKIITDPQDRKAINKVMSVRKDFIEDLNLFIHDVTYIPTETQIRDIWKTFGRPIFDIISKIK